MASSSLRVEVDRSAIRSILKGGPMQGILSDEARKVASRANARMTGDMMSNDAFMSAVDIGSVSAKGRVFTANPHGARAQAKYHILESSV